MGRPKAKLVTFKLSSTSDLWNQEYSVRKVIPSSTRMLPSKALVLFSELLGFSEGLDVLDAGCGTGRNAIYLARKGCNVHALDFSQAALECLKEASIQAGVEGKIDARYHELQTSFPFRSDAFDLVLDSYVFCHFTDEELKLFYRDELCRVVKPSGFIFSSVFSTDDEYYEAMNPSGDRGGVVVDPNNGLTKRLYHEEEIATFFSASFDVLYFTKFQFKDVVLGKSYKRSIFILVLRKRT